MCLAAVVVSGYVRQGGAPCWTPYPQGLTRPAVAHSGVQGYTDTERLCSRGGGTHIPTPPSHTHTQTVLSLSLDSVLAVSSVDVCL